jgi:argininosuccinate lyase
MPAVEMAEYLTARGIPFREAHGIVGRMVRDCEERGKFLRDMKLKEMTAHSRVFEEDVFDYIDPRNILKMRKTLGGASFDEVEKEIAREKIYCSR